MLLVLSSRTEYEPEFSFTSILYPVISEPPSDGLFQVKLIWVSEITFAERLGDDGLETDEVSISIESSVGVADAVFESGLNVPPLKEAFTTYVYVLSVCKPLTVKVVVPLPVVPISSS